MAGFSVPVTQSFYQGQINSQGSVYVYQTGTTTPVNLYSDGGLTQPIQNPITLDVNGEALFYVGSTVNLRLDYYISNNTFVESIDPVYVIPDLTSAGSSVSNSFGGYVNKFRNGTFDIAQRGTSGTTSSNTGVYTLDGWIVGCSSATVAWSQVYTAIDDVYANFLQLTGASSMTDTFIRQRIESYICAPLVGDQVTVQFNVDNATSTALTAALTIKHAASQDSWTSSVVDINAVSLQTLAAGTSGTLAYTYSAPAGAQNGIEVTLDFGAALNSNLQTINITDADIRSTPSVTTSGLNNTPPTPELRPISAELAFCQRYLPAFGDFTGVIATGAATSTTSSGFFIPLAVSTRVVTTGLSLLTTSSCTVVNYAAAGVNPLTGMSFSASLTSNQALFVTTTVASGLTSNVPYVLNVHTPAAGNLIFTGAEL